MSNTYPKTSLLPLNIQEWTAFELSWCYKGPNYDLYDFIVDNTIWTPDDRPRYARTVRAISYWINQNIDWLIENQLLIPDGIFLDTAFSFRANRIMRSTGKMYIDIPALNRALGSEENRIGRYFGV